MSVALYRHFGADGDLLYVGVSLSVMIRLSTHKRSPWFVSVATVSIEHFQDRPTALAAELKAIQTEHPMHNKAHNTVGPRRPLAATRDPNGTVNTALAKVGNVARFASRHRLPLRTVWRVVRGENAPRKGTLLLIEAALKKERLL